MRAPSYREHSSGQARVTFGGKDYLLGPHGSKESKEKYRRLVSEYIASDCSANFDKVPEDISIVEVVAAYKKHAKGWYKSSPKTYEFVMLAVRPLVELYGSTDAGAFGPKQFKACRKYVMDGKLRGPKASTFETLPSRKYVNDLMSRMKKVFSWAAEEELIPSSVHETLSKVQHLQPGRTTAPEDTRALLSRLS
jgi:hypothetical protein